MESSKAHSKQVRDPPPSLFLGPPSQNASHVSLSASLQAGAAPPTPTTLLPSSAASRKAPPIRQRSQRLRSANIETLNDASTSAPLPRPTLPKQQTFAENKPADRTDALWAEMQSTLEEVELSAVNGLHVFGSEHSKALDALRAAQITLAQAWARSEAEDVKEDEGIRDLKSIGGRKTGSDGKSTAKGTEGPMHTASARPGSSGGGPGAAEMMGSKLEKETEADIAYARKRREDNDKYFQKVNRGVLDVVAKLEDVATAMRSVELETRDMWGENDSAGTSLRGQ